MTNKLLISVHEGVIQVEGEIDFVKEVYADFKNLIKPLMKDALLSRQNLLDTLPQTTPVKSKTRKTDCL